MLSNTQTTKKQTRTHRATTTNNRRESQTQEQQQNHHFSTTCSDYAVNLHAVTNAVNSAVTAPVKPHTAGAPTTFGPVGQDIAAICVVVAVRACWLSAFNLSWRAFP
jgi:hypothetical protein